MLCRLHIQHELRQRAVQTRDAATHECEARSAEQCAGVEVQAQRRAQVHMVLGCEVEGARAAPAAHFDVGVFVGAHRYAVMRQVRQAHQQLVQLGLDALQRGRALAQLRGDAGHLGHRRGAVLALGLELADLLTQAVALGLQFFHARLQRLAFGLERGITRHVEKGLRRLACLQPLDHMVEVAAQQVDIEHFVVLFGVEAARRGGSAPPVESTLRRCASPTRPCCGRPGPAAAGRPRPPAHRARAARSPRPVRAAVR